MKEDNPVRRIRQSLGLNQADFGRLLGRSHQSVRNYENGIGEVPDAVVERLKTLAAEKGLADIALELSSDDWKVRTVIFSPHDFSDRQKPGAGVHSFTRHQKEHSLLDEILDSDDPDACRAVRSNLIVFGKFVAAKKHKPASARHAK